MIQPHPGAEIHVVSQNLKQRGVLSAKSEFQTRLMIIFIQNMTTFCTNDDARHDHAG